MVRRLLDAHHRPRLDAAPANFSLTAAGSDVRAGRRELNLLYQGWVVVARERTRADLLHRLVDQIETATWFDRTDLLVVHGVAVLTDNGRAVLLPEGTRVALLPRERLLRRAGLVLSHALVHLVDHTTGDLVMERRTVRVDPAALAGATIEPAPVGRFPVYQWLVFGPEQPGCTLRTALGVARTLPQVETAAGTQRALTAVAAMLGIVPVVVADLSGPGLLTALEAIAS